MQEFNKITTFSSFIKNLLSTTYLPVIRTVREGDFILKDFVYLYRCNVIKCTQSGFIGSGKYLCKYDIIDEYDFGIDNPKISTSYTSNKEGYDSYTHIRLGNYLRSLRDMYGLNLMPLYNCFTNQVLPQHYIHSNRITKMTADKNVTLYKIPIRFNQTYTICVENPGQTRLAPAFLYFDSLLALNNNKYQNGLDVTGKFISLYNSEHIKQYSNLRFNHPVTFRVDNIPGTRSISYNQVSTYKMFEVNKNLPKYYTATTDNTEPNLYKNVINYKQSKDEEVDFEKLYFKLTDGGYQLVDDLTPYDIPKDQNWFEIESQNFTLVEDAEESEIYYKSIDPSSVEFEWYELTGEGYGDGYEITEDTYIKPDKKYYIESDGPLEERKNYSYKIYEDDCLFFQPYEQYLNLLIQVPDSLKSSIVVLEGDYTKTESEKLFDEYYLEDYSNDYLDHLFTGRLKLMSANTKKSYPFSTELREYLLWNVVNPLDSINNNLDRLKLAADEAFDNFISPVGNYWTNNFRHLIYTYANNMNHKFMFDNLGYENAKVEEMFHMGSEQLITIEDASEDE